MKRWLTIASVVLVIMIGAQAQAFSVAGSVTGGNPIGFPPHLKYVIAVPLSLDTTNFLSNLALVNPTNGNYSFSSLDSGSYIMFSFQDMNFSFLPDLDEPRGFWSTDTLLGVPSILTLTSNMTGINIVLNPPNTGGFTGTLSYGGAQRGRAYVMAYYDANFDTLRGMGTMLDTVTSGNGSYTALTDTFRTYYAYAYLDANGNFVYDEDEPYGVFGGANPAPINVQQSNFPDNVNITMVDPAPSSGEFSGVVSYSGAARGPSYVVAFRDAQFSAAHGFGPVQDGGNTGNGPFTASTDSFGVYYAYAFMDLNGDLLRDANEPFGIYGGDSPSPIQVTPDNPPGNVDITLLDPEGITPRHALPTELRLTSVYPNPFNNSATIAFSAGVAENITLELYDVLGRKVAVLLQDRVEPGEHRVALRGAALSTGVYFVKLSGAHSTQSQPVLLLK